MSRKVNKRSTCGNKRAAEFNGKESSLVKKEKQELEAAIEFTLLQGPRQSLRRRETMPIVKKEEKDDAMPDELTSSGKIESLLIKKVKLESEAVVELTLLQGPRQSLRRRETKPIVKKEEKDDTMPDELTSSVKIVMTTEQSLLKVGQLSHCDKKLKPRFKKEAKVDKKESLLLAVKKEEEEVSVPEQCSEFTEDEVSEPDIDAAGKSLHKCEYCEKSFEYKSHLTRHVRVHTGEKPCRCDVCSKSFSQSSNLSTHKRFHSGKKPYRCDVCGKSFALRCDLSSHKRIHSGDKPYSCDVCGTSFSQSGSISSHKRIHSGEKPYGCDVCGVSFARGDQLSAHKRVHSGEKPYGCDVCGVYFARQRLSFCAQAGTFWRKAVLL